MKKTFPLFIYYRYVNSILAFPESENFGEPEKKHYIKDKQKIEEVLPGSSLLEKTYSSVCFGIRTLNMSQKVDHLSHPLIVAFPFNKEQLSILLFYSRPT